MNKKARQNAGFTEKDIESTILYLKTNTNTYPSRENAINYLRTMQGAAHIIAHKIISKKK